MTSPEDERTCMGFIQFYYSVFNNAPDLLFSFHNGQLVFTHKSVFGTKKESYLTVSELKISQIIKLFNFEKCHIMLNRIKCLEVTGNKIIIEAVGELTDGKHARYCFKQTFLLKSDGPIKSDQDGAKENPVLYWIEDEKIEYNVKLENRLQQQFPRALFMAEKNNAQLLTEAIEANKRLESQWFECTNVAIRTGNLRYLDRLLKNRAKINDKDSNGRTLLHEATTCNKKNIVLYLLRNSADVLQTTSKGFTPLHIAALNGHTDLVFTLLRETYNCHAFYKLIDAKTSTAGETALDIATEKGFHKIVKILKDCKARQEDYHETWAECWIEYWTSYKIDELRKDKSKNDLIECESQNDLFKYNFKNDFFGYVDLDEFENDSFEYWDSDESESESVEEIIDEETFNLNLECDTVKSLLKSERRYHLFPMQAYKAQELDKLLTQVEEIFINIKKCTSKLGEVHDRKSLDLKEGSRILNYTHEIVEAFDVYQLRLCPEFVEPNVFILKKILQVLEFDKEHSYSEIAGKFKSKGIGTRYYKLLNSTDESRKQIFLEFAKNFIAETVQSFIKSIYASKIFDAVQRDDFSFVLRYYCRVNNSLPPKVIDANGRTPLHIATMKNSEKMVQTLLQQGVDIKTATTTTKSTSLHIAAAKGYQAIVEILLRNNNSREFIDAKTAVKNSTALHAAAKNNYISIVKSLLANGANYCLRDVDGKTPCELSTEKEIQTFFQLINDLFTVARIGSNELVIKMKKLPRDSLLAVGNARNFEGLTLVQVVEKGGYASIARQARQVVNKMEKIRNRPAKKK